MTPRLLILSALFIVVGCSSTRSAVDEARRLHDQGRVIEAAELLDAEQKRSRTPAERARLTIARARVLTTHAFLTGEGLDDILRLLDDVKSEVDGSTDSSLRGAWHDARGFALYLRALTASENTLDAAAGHFARAVEERRQAGDTRGLAESLFHNGLVRERKGDVAAAEPWYLESRDLAASAGHLVELSYAIRHLGFLAQEAGRLGEAKALLTESLRLREKAGFRVYMASSYSALAAVALAEGDRANALRYYERALDAARAVGAKRIEGMVMTSIGKLRNDDTTQK